MHYVTIGFAVFGAWLALCAFAFGSWSAACWFADRRAARRLRDEWLTLTLDGWLERTYGRRRRRGGFRRRRASSLTSRVAGYTTGETPLSAAFSSSLTPHGAVSAGSEILRTRLAGNRNGAAICSGNVTAIGGHSLRVVAPCNGQRPDSAA